MGEPGKANQQIVDVGTFGTARGEEAVLATRTLGSGLGVSVFDLRLHLGCLLHAVLPLSSVELELANKHPGIFVDTGLIAVFDQFFEAGGRRRDMCVKVAGCAIPIAADDLFRFGERNLEVAQRVFAENEIEVAGHAVGGFESRSMRLHLDTGEVFLSVAGSEWLL